ncbi:MAG: cysteine desulfurase [Marinifilaceae bacterium]
MKFDVNKIREDFPILQEKVYGKSLIYMDNGATSQKPKQVVEKIVECYYKYNSNIHRGVHYLSNKCTDIHEESREIVRSFIGASSIKEIIFTAGTTESVNLLANSFGQKFISEGDEIIISEMEHHSNIVPWQLLCERRGAKIKVLPFNESGELLIDELDNLITDKTKLLCVGHVSNSLGTVNPIKEITKIAHSRGVKVLVDAAQSVQHIKIDVQDIDCDFLVFSAHKLYGPTGVGVLYGKENLLVQMPPWQGGGEMIETVSFDKTTFNELPFKFEAGTPNYIGNIALGEAIRYIECIGIDNIALYEEKLLAYATEKLSSVPGLIIYGNAKVKASLISFLIEDLHPYDVGTLLDKMGIAVRTGTHCAETVMQHYDIPGTIRASFAFYNTKEEIDILYEGLMRICKIFGKFK